MKQIVLLASSLLFSIIAQAQFTDITEQLEALDVNITSPTNGYGSGISFYDFNGDGWDDLSIAGGSNDPVFLVNNNGVYEPAPFTNITNPGSARIHSMLWVDYDNDGDADLFISRNNGPMQLWQNDGNMNFTNVAGAAGLEQAFYIYANACWGDYNHDGCLDLYVTKNYSFFNYMDTLYTSQLYKNNCDGTFTEVTEEAGVQLIPRTELQPVWVDVNNDGWEDLFIAVDRLPFENELFINNTDGTFTRVTETSGVDLYLDAMGASVADYNQDGYLDIYVGNNPLNPGNAFYENNGDGTFTNIAPAMGLDFGPSSELSTWGAMWMDYNNNTWEDLFLATMIFTAPPHPGSLIYSNNEGQSFTDITASANINSPVPTETFTLAMGDINNDGYYDYATGNRHPYTPRLKLNNGGENNYLSVELEGTLANRDGIGTWIRCYAGGQQQVRYTMCGENLAGQNSNKKIFGLAQYDVVDSLVLDWNSGTHEVYYDLDVNQQLYLIEGASFLEPVSIAYNGDLQVCPGESIVLDAGDHDEYLWNTGHDGQFLTVDESGSYSVEVFNSFGLSVQSDTVEVLVTPLADVAFDVENISCTGANDGSVEMNLSNGPVQSIEWNNGSETPLITDLDGGIYSFTGTDQYGCPVSGEVAVNEPSPIFAQALPSDASCYGTATGSVELQALGGTPPYTTDWNGLNPDSIPAGNYTAVCFDQNGCSVNLNYTIEEPDSLSAGLTLGGANVGQQNGSADLEISGGTAPYTVEWSSGDSNTLSIDSLAPGDYSVTVTDSEGCIATWNFNIELLTSIDEQAQNPLQLFPNPTNQYVRVAGSLQPTLDIWMMDAAGRVVQIWENHNADQAIALDRMQPGSYMLRIQDGDRQRTLRLIIAR